MQKVDPSENQWVWNSPQDAESRLFAKAITIILANTLKSTKARSTFNGMIECNVSQCITICITPLFNKFTITYMHPSCHKTWFQTSEITRIFLLFCSMYFQIKGVSLRENATRLSSPAADTSKDSCSGCRKTGGIQVLSSPSFAELSLGAAPYATSVAVECLGGSIFS